MGERVTTTATFSFSKTAAEYNVGFGGDMGLMEITSASVGEGMYYLSDLNDRWRSFVHLHLPLPMVFTCFVVPTGDYRMPLRNHGYNAVIKSVPGIAHESSR